MRTISHTYKILPFVIFSLFSFSSKIMNLGKGNMNVNYFANKKKIYKERRLNIANLHSTDPEFSFEAKADTIFHSLDSANFSMPDFKIFSKALKGFYALKANGQVQKDVLTIIDFSLSSTAKRLWVIDLNTHKVLYQSLVAHGRNSGEEFATSFSNKRDSNKSSLGFYATGETYRGKHGTSLKLDGLEKGINDNARQRGVVVHSSRYVSDAYLKSMQKIGRSQGCPALPEEFASKIINVIKNKSCLFIYHPSMNNIKEIS